MTEVRFREFYPRYLAIDIAIREICVYNFLNHFTECLFNVNGGNHIK